jgi:hypothetical protein
VFSADRVVLELAELAFLNIFDFIEVHADGSVQIDLLRTTRERAAAIHDVAVRRSAEGLGDEGRSVKLIKIERSTCWPHSWQPRLSGRNRCEWNLFGTYRGQGFMPASHSGLTYLTLFRPAVGGAEGDRTSDLRLANPSF